MEYDWLSFVDHVTVSTPLDHYYHKSIILLLLYYYSVYSGVEYKRFILTQGSRKSVSGCHPFSITQKVTPIYFQLHRTGSLHDTSRAVEIPDEVSTGVIHQSVCLGHVQGQLYALNNFQNKCQPWRTYRIDSVQPWMARVCSSAFGLLV